MYHRVTVKLIVVHCTISLPLRLTQIKLLISAGDHVPSPVHVVIDPVPPSSVLESLNASS